MGKGKQELVAKVSESGKYAIIVQDCPIYICNIIIEKQNTEIINMIFETL